MTTSKSHGEKNDTSRVTDGSDVPAVEPPAKGELPNAEQRAAGFATDETEAATQSEGTPVYDDRGVATDPSKVFAYPDGPVEKGNKS